MIASKIVQTPRKMMRQIMKDVFHHQIKICTWNETAEGFRILANFPNRLEAVDGKHVRVVKSG